MADFNWPTLIWPTALIVFSVLFFRAYYKDMRHTPDTGKKKKKRLLRTELSFLEPPGHMTSHDWLAALALTVIYGVLAFSFTGDTAAPQTFWRATEENPAVILDLGETVELGNIMLYVGLNDNTIGETHFFWTLSLSADGQDWYAQPYKDGLLEPLVDHNSMFSWKAPEMQFNTLPVRYIRIASNMNGKMELGELAIVVLDDKGGRTLMDVTRISTAYPQYTALFDEQNLIPASFIDLDTQTVIQAFEKQTNYGTVSTNKNGMVFDESLHVSASYEFIRNLYPTAELTHPPLGKEIIALGIILFGMVPFGWRFMGILFGVLMIPLLYVFITNLFGNAAQRNKLHIVSLCGTVLFTFENLHFSQTHMATLDTFVVFFIIAMYLFMYRYISSGYDEPFRKTLPALFLCGLSFGLGAASKWTAFYAALGLILLYAVYLVKRGKHMIAAGQKKEFRIFLYKTLSASAAFFVIIPLIIYTLSYIPYIPNGTPLTVSGLLRVMWNNQLQMLNYHGIDMKGIDYTTQSKWWQWMLDIKPITYYGRVMDGSRAMIGAFTNPLVTVSGLVAIIIALFDFFRKKAKEAFVIVVGYLAQLLPWSLVPRASFAYHYFPSVVFLTLAICYIFNNILKHNPDHKWRIYVFTGVSVALFFMLLPPTAGIQIPDWYSTWFVRWLPDWTF